MYIENQSENFYSLLPEFFTIILDGKSIPKRCVSKRRISMMRELDKFQAGQLITLTIINDNLIVDSGLSNL
ncbi:MAG: hypothetical protein R1F52_00775 [Candidatus Nitrosoabyssus spongiisocia]|nr:MAG: hypothetical protein R1F52_00775 [Nitrosopumilaceae archaeon AB1(1)]